MPRANQDELVQCVYKLEGLHCPSCAAKIEGAAAKVEGVAQASIDFAAGRLTVNSLKSKQTEIKTEIERLSQEIEPGVKLREEHSHAHNHEDEHGHAHHRDSSESLLALGAALALFAGGLLLPLPQVGKTVLLLASYLLAGFPILRSALLNLRRGRVFDENFLMTVATLGALVIRETPEAAAVMLFYRTGEYLQNLAVDRSRRSISALIALRPDQARVVRNGTALEVPAGEVIPGDELLVQPGERIPVDGTILTGLSSLDTAALTGESVPRDAGEGDHVLAGFINLSGMIRMRAERPASDSAISRILDLVENAAARKSPTEEFITKFARYYTPAVVGVAALLALLPPLFIPGAAFADWVYRALVFLVISCPCALVVSIPLGFFGGIGAASKAGVLVKGSNYLQALHEVDTVVFDKTGTLTSGEFTVDHVESVPGVKGEYVLQMAAWAESMSRHPIALSIVEAWGGEFDPTAVGDFQEITGLGISATIQGHQIACGSQRLMQHLGITGEFFSHHGQAVHVAVDGKYVGAVLLSDTPKRDAEAALTRLKELGAKQAIMLTGDSAAAAAQAGEMLGIADVRSELLPGDKLTELEKILAGTRKGRVAYVGDGINDAPVLARADVGIAMGGLGQDAAIEAADVVIMTDEPSKVADAVAIARRTNKIVRQNIVLAVGVKLLVLSLGALGLTTLWWAVFADVGVTVLAVLNSIRATRLPAKQYPTNRTLTAKAIANY
jgi:Cd2+/Zn2+-exporting ATPase